MYVTRKNFDGQFIQTTYLTRINVDGNLIQTIDIQFTHTMEDSSTLILVLSERGYMG